jgi:hypothetical protein
MPQSTPAIDTVRVVGDRLPADIYKASMATSEVRGTGHLVRRAARPYAGREMPDLRLAFGK